MNYDDHIDKLISIVDEIKVNEVTVLTGGNGKGKSMIRKVLWQSISKQLNLSKPSVIDISMERRTKSHPELGGLAGVFNDLEWLPTSLSTYDLIKKLVDGQYGEKFLVIDEPEIGMSRESQLGLVNYLNKKIPNIMGGIQGLLIITHSELIVEEMKYDKFINLEGLNKNEWLNRELVPTNFEELNKSSTELMRAIQNRLHKQ